MARKKKKDDDTATLQAALMQKVKRCVPITIPAIDNPESHRYLPWVRYGKLSSEVFCKNPQRRKELGLEASLTLEPSLTEIV